MTEEDAMRRAIEVARRGIAEGQSPFGAAIIRGDELIAAAHNTVWRDGDPTAHAEVNAIRAAARALGTIDLSGTTLCSTCEPCPMCLAATHWARVDRGVFGARIADAAAAGFRELAVDAALLAKLGKSPLVVRGGLLSAEAAGLFDEWKAAPRPETY